MIDGFFFIFLGLWMISALAILYISSGVRLNYLNMRVQELLDQIPRSEENRDDHSILSDDLGPNNRKIVVDPITGTYKKIR